MTVLTSYNGLELALYRPNATFEGKELYPSPVEKAAAILESVLINHPFIDGNKRIGYVLMKLIHLQNNMTVIASEDEDYNMIFYVSKGESDRHAICSWLKEHLIIIE